MADYKIAYKKQDNEMIVKAVKVKKPCIVQIPSMVKDKFVTKIDVQGVGGKDVIGYVLTSKSELPQDAGKSVAAVILPESLKNIGRSAFAHTDLLKKVELPSGLLYVDEDAFAECKMLEEVKFNDGLKVIDFSAFEETSLKEVHIPKSVEEVGFSAFQNCSKLEKITVEDGNAHYRVDGNCLIDCDEKMVIAAGNGFTLPTDPAITKIEDMSCGGRDMVTLDIPENIKSIGSNAFEGCKRLTTIIVRGATFIDDFAFCDCESLRSVTLPACLESLSAWAFEDCEKMQRVEFGGTREQWKKLVDDGNPFDEKVRVSCSDGTI